MKRVGLFVLLAVALAAVTPIALAWSWQHTHYSRGFSDSWPEQMYYIFGATGDMIYVTYDSVPAGGQSCTLEITFTQSGWSNQQDITVGKQTTIVYPPNEYSETSIKVECVDLFGDANFTIYVYAEG